MKLSPFAIKNLVPFVTGDIHRPKRSGPELVELFNKYGARDIYDWNNGGLPELKKNGQRPARKQYAEARLNDLSGKPELRTLLEQVINERENKSDLIDTLNEILAPEHFSVVESDGILKVHGGVIDNRKPVVNEAHFQHIQGMILSALDEAKLSIWVVMAWFTNETLMAKLVEKYKQGLDVRLAIYDDGVNAKHGVDITQVPHQKIKRGQRGGLMHNKFCIIDNQIVMTGSYNWTNNAETRNDENTTIERDPDQSTKYSLEYKRLTSS